MNSTTSPVKSNQIKSISHLDDVFGVPAIDAPTTARRAREAIAEGRVSSRSASASARAARDAPRAPPTPRASCARASLALGALSLSLSQKRPLARAGSARLRVTRRSPRGDERARDLVQMDRAVEEEPRHLLEFARRQMIAQLAHRALDVARLPHETVAINSARRDANRPRRRAPRVVAHLREKRLGRVREAHRAVARLDLRGVEELGLGQLIRFRDAVESNRIESNRVEPIHLLDTARRAPVARARRPGEDLDERRRVRLRRRRAKDAAMSDMTRI